MVPNWFKMARLKGGGWRKSLYQSPDDPKLRKDIQRMEKMVQALVTAQIDGRSHAFSELEQTASLLNRIRLFLHLYLTLETNLKEAFERQAVSILSDLNMQRIQIQALSIWSVSNSSDAPIVWKKAQRRRGVSAMPWRAAVSYAENSQFATDLHWIKQARYDKALGSLAQNYGGMAYLGEGLRSSNLQTRQSIVEAMGHWLNKIGEEGVELFRAHTRQASKKRFNFAAIDASERALEQARRIALERGPKLSERYYNYVRCGDDGQPNWHDRYALEEKVDYRSSWKTVKSQTLKILRKLHPEAERSGQLILASDNISQPKGRGGGFTTPVFFNAKGQYETGPFVYAPFDGSADSQRTLTHEMGHAVHAYMSANQGAMLSDAGWAVAESIALACEQFLFKQDHRALIDQDFAMLVHQPAIAMFERELGVSTHDMHVDAIWIGALRAHYGHSVSLKGYEPFWRRHSMSISAPGYPMAYLLGWALAGYIRDQLETDAAGVQSSLFEVLKSGGKIGFDDAADLLGVLSISELIHRAYDQAEARLMTEQYARF